MPRILVIEPGLHEAAYSPFATAQGATPLTFDSGTEIVRCSARLPATTVESAPEALLLDLAVYEAGLRAEQDGFDAVYVHHALDPGVGALRSVLSVPVLGAGRAARLYALTLGSRFAILAPDCGTAARLKHVIHDEGLDSACASVRALEAGEPGEESTCKAAGHCIETDGADVIVLGSTRMSEFTRTLSSFANVPIVDPGPLSLTLLESLLALGLRHSRRAHPEPMVRKDALVRALVDAVVEPGRHNRQNI